MCWRHRLNLRPAEPLMSKQTLQSTKEGAFINATLAQARLVSEHVTSVPGAPSSEPKQIQLRVDTSSAFSIALDDMTKPNHILVEIDYKLSLKKQDTDKQLLDYEAKHVAQFNIARWLGFDDWTDVPNGAMAPYLAMIQNIAMRRAESTLVDMGLRGINLPVSPVDKPDVAETKTEVAEPVK